MHAYQFITIWRVHSPIEKVWNEIHDSDSWPEWWQGVESVEKLQQGDELGVGSVRRYIWKSKLPYRLTFNMKTIRIEAPTLLEGTASGELQGTGRWQLTEDKGATMVRYDWRVQTNKPWMNLLAPIAHPFFKWNHDVVMSWGAEGLAHRLQTKVIQI